MLNSGLSKLFFGCGKCMQQTQSLFEDRPLAEGAGPCPLTNLEAELVLANAACTPVTWNMTSGVSRKHLKNRYVFMLTCIITQLNFKQVILHMLLFKMSKVKKHICLALATVAQLVGVSYAP